jgi:hypothetical protein
VSTTLEVAWALCSERHGLEHPGLADSAGAAQKESEAAKTSWAPLIGSSSGPENLSTLDTVLT